MDEAPANSEQLLRVSTLSEWQRWLLGQLLRLYETHGTPHYHRGFKLAHLPPGTSRSDSAVRSRSLRSLERRGYVRRRNQTSGDAYDEDWEEDEERKAAVGRTTHLEFTPAGRALAEALRGVNSEKFSELAPPPEEGAA